MNGRHVLLLLSGAIIFSLTGCSTSNNYAQPTPTVRPSCPAPSIEDHPAIQQSRANALLGMTESGAKSCAHSLGWAFRTGSRDGQEFALTMDYSTGRVTVSVKKDTVFKVVIG